MNKTKIPWCDYSINPVKGLCPMACEYCYARKMYKRFKWNPEIRWKSGMDRAVALLKKPSKIFVGSTIELFGDWIEPEWMQHILAVVELYKAHTFIFLTKHPFNLMKFSPYPDNCWVGVSATEFEQYVIGLVHLNKVKAPVKLFSFEPLLREIAPEKEYSGYKSELMALDLKYTGINWIIIGSRTQPTRHPRLEWVEEIITAADRANIPVFVKEPLASYYNIQRKEFPSE